MDLGALRGGPLARARTARCCSSASDGRWLLALQLTSKDHDGYPAPGGRRRWVDIGSGGWDRQGRPSEVRVDRVVRVDPKAVRREGAVLSRQRFDAVARAVADLHR